MALQSDGYTIPMFDDIDADNAPDFEGYVDELKGHVCDVAEDNMRRGGEPKASGFGEIASTVKLRNGALVEATVRVTVTVKRATIKA